MGQRRNRPKAGKRLFSKGLEKGEWKDSRLDIVEGQIKEEGW